MIRSMFSCPISIRSQSAETKKFFPRSSPIDRRKLTGNFVHAGGEGAPSDVFHRDERFLFIRPKNFRSNIRQIDQNLLTRQNLLDFISHESKRIFVLLHSADNQRTFRRNVRKACEEFGKSDSLVINASRECRQVYAMFNRLSVRGISEAKREKMKTSGVEVLVTCLIVLMFLLRNPRTSHQQLEKISIRGVQRRRLGRTPKRRLLNKRFQLIDRRTRLKTKTFLLRFRSRRKTHVLVSRRDVQLEPFANRHDGIGTRRTATEKSEQRSIDARNGDPVRWQNFVENVRVGVVGKEFQNVVRTIENFVGNDALKKRSNAEKNERTNNFETNLNVTFENDASPRNDCPDSSCRTAPAHCE